MNIRNKISLMNPEPKQENFFKEIIKFTLIALAIVIPIRTFVAQPFIVSGASMDPTFDTGQYLIVDQMTYHLEDPKRYDVIVFKYPINPKIYFIKRIIGLPGEKISIKQGKVSVINKENPDGITLEDSYVTPEHQTSENFEINLSDTEYFVMGDNRGQSSDSRSWGPLDIKYIIGRPFVRLFPISKMGLFPGSIHNN
jgi:signal peptidase I